MVEQRKSVNRTQLVRTDGPPYKYCASLYTWTVTLAQICTFKKGFSEKKYISEASKIISAEFQYSNKMTEILLRQH